MINLIDEEVKVNENELKFLNYFYEGDEFDGGSLIGIPDIDIEGFSKNQVAGYISDLVGKYLITILNGKEYSLGCDCVLLPEKIFDQL